MATFKIETVPLSKIDAAVYQRDLKPEHVKDIVSKFDPPQWDLPKVVLRTDGTYHVVAGKNRVEAARELSALGRWPFDEPDGDLLCQVIYGITSIEEEANLFLEDATNTLNLTPFNKHHAGLTAKKPRALDIEEACNNVGIPVVQRQRNLTGGSISAISQLNRVWGKNGKTVLDETMTVIAAWPATDAYRCFNYLVGGLGDAIGKQVAAGKYNRKRFIARMSKPQNQPVELHRRAHVLAAKTSLPFNSPLPFQSVIERS
jgi:hypothetical protein